MLKSIRISETLRHFRTLLCRTGATLCGFALVACVSGPPSQQSELTIEMPGNWVASSAAIGVFQPEEWSKDFGDPLLESIIKEALVYNYDLKAAVARLDAAMASALADRSTLWPTLGLNGNGTRSRRNASAGIQQTPTSETYGLTGRLNWEVDLWGKIRNGARGALADEEAAIADFYAARLSIAGQVAKAWYAAIEAMQQYELEVRLLAALEESSRIVEENFASGIARALDVRLVRANLAANKSSLEQRRRNRDASIRNLETLLGRYPATELEVASRLPDFDETLPAGLPSELLLRRPDVIAAERRLAAAEQRSFEASKARIPSINLNLTRGTSTSELNDIFQFVEERIWSQSLSVSQPIFQGRRLKADHDRAKAVYEQTLAGYSQIVLNALREVENALSNQTSTRLDYEFLQIAASESIEAEKLAWDEYARGLTDITTALDSVRRSISSQRLLIQIANLRIQNRIELYLALGGGFGSNADS